jgi:hypothetical protein
MMEPTFRTSTPNSSSIPVSTQRRCAMRYVLQAPVAFCWIDSEGSTCHSHGRTQDVSTKGIRILSPVSLPVGVCVAMNIDIPLPRTGQQPMRIEVQGRVVRFESAGSKRSFCIEYDRVCCPE